jgi:hypothetical protein
VAFSAIGTDDNTDEQVDVSAILSADNLYTVHPQFWIFNRWSGGGNKAIRFGIRQNNMLILDVNRLTAPLDNNNFTYRWDLSVSAGQYHALRLTSRTLGSDVYTDGYAHFNLTSLSTLSWTRIFTLGHFNGQSTVNIAIHALGWPFGGYTASGNLNGLTTPCVQGKSGVGFSDGRGGYWGANAETCPFFTRDWQVFLGRSE